jgi:hypothetical protein
VVEAVSDIVPGVVSAKRQATVTHCPASDVDVADLPEVGGGTRSKRRHYFLSSINCVKSGYVETVL